MFSIISAESDSEEAVESGIDFERKLIVAFKGNQLNEKGN